MTSAAEPQHQQRRRDRRQPQQQGLESGMIERVVQINHVAKVVKGGRRFGFSTIVVVGDGAGSVGVSIGKAKEVPESITKGRSGAMKHMIKMKVVEGTIPHEIVGRCGATRVLLRPAVPGTGIIAGKSVRAILEAAGIKDILSKTIGSSNAVNVVKAAMDGLVRLMLPEDVAEMRGKTVGEIFIAKRVRRTGRIEEEPASDRKDAAETEPLPATPRRRDQRPGQGRPSPDSRSPAGRPRTGMPPGSGESRRPQDRRPDRRPRPDGRPARGDVAAGQGEAPPGSPAP